MLTKEQVSLNFPNWDQGQWYYTVELCPGTFTKGLEFNNIALTRQMLNNINLEGATVIDIGCMEGAISMLMAKRGARVIAADGIDLSDRVALVRRAHGVHFDYFPDMPLGRFADRIFEIQTAKGSWPHLLDQIGPSEETPFGFDVVLSSGVLYHVLHPIDHLLTYRKLCKLGGLVVLEAGVAISDDVSMVHSMRPTGMLYSGIATWFVSTAALDVFLRAAFLEPLAYCYVARETVGDVDVARVGIVSRAVRTRGFDPQRYRRYEEIRNSELFINIDFASLAPAALLTGCVSQAPTLSMDGLYSAEDGLIVSGFDSNKPLPYTQDDLRFTL